jgi:hypothetical protein
MPINQFTPGISVTDSSDTFFNLGLKNRLSTQGSKFTYTAEGSIPLPYPIDYVPPVNPLATNNSNLHYDKKFDTEGWSTKGYQSPNFAKTVQDYNAYKDGITNYLPNPSSLEIEDPIGADAKYKLKYNYTNGGYIAVAQTLI